MQRITRLRVAVFSSANNTLNALVPAASHILSDLCSVPAESWNESYEIPHAPACDIYASIFRIACILYFLLSLPEAITDPARARQRDPFVAGASPALLRSHYRRLLMGKLQAARGFRSRIFPFSWAVAVAGVACHDASVSERAELIELLRSIIAEPPWYRGPVTLLQILPRFWATGKTGWDDCFYKPFQVGG